MALGDGKQSSLGAGEMLFGAVTKTDLIRGASCGKVPTSLFSEAEQDLTIPGKTRSEQVRSFCRNQNFNPVKGRFAGPTILNPEHPYLRELLASPDEDGTSWPVPRPKAKGRGTGDVPCS